MKSRTEARTQKRVELDEIHQRLAAIEAMTVSELREECERVFDEPTASRNRQYLIKRISYRVQEMMLGGLSELARKRIDELARNAPIRRRLLNLMPYLNDVPTTAAPPADAPSAPLETMTAAPLDAPPPRPRDPRLPAPGTTVRKRYREVDYDVLVLEDGFEMAGKRYRGLSGVARAITGGAWNGFLFFRDELASATGEQA
ncbi:MAG: DUF2924 domain-containing protein [Polyangiaceae bacterium]|nr:DUF2924 domain-containing protein [Polyangiaceae bacterium]